MSRLALLLADTGADHQIIEHEPEGRTDVASEIRGHPLGQAAKCVVVRVKVTKKRSRLVLAVVPGDRRADMDSLTSLYGGVRAMFADVETAERVTSTVRGAIVPFTFDPDLALVVDVGLLQHDEILFNAGVLDRSVSIKVDDYCRIAQPCVASIAI